MDRCLKRTFVMLLCLSLLFGLAVPAFAAEAVSAAEAPAGAAPVSSEPTASPPQESILDSDAITAAVEEYLAKKGISKDRVGIGYCYTATGDEWFYNPDTWFYPGSMYKVPLMMQLAEKIKNGETSPDTMIGGLDLATVFEYILVYSNNDYAHRVRTFLGGDEVWREDAKEYAGLDSYDERYMLYCYFSPRYITRVVETLFKEPDRFPGVTENLLTAEQGHYFRLLDEMHPYSIAQKYGSYLDNEGSDWNGTTGIIYLPNPIVLTVMTKNVGGSELLIGELAALFKDYTLELDGKLISYQQEKAEAEKAAEAERIAAEQAQPGPVQPVSESIPQPQQTESDRPVPEQAVSSDRASRGHRAGIIVLAILLAGSVIGGIAAVLIVKDHERKRYESFKRRFEEEMRQQALDEEQGAPSSYRAPSPSRSSQRSSAPSRPVSPSRSAARSIQRPSRPDSGRSPFMDLPDSDEDLWDDDEDN